MQTVIRDHLAHTTVKPRRLDHSLAIRSGESCREALHTRADSTPLLPTPLVVLHVSLHGAIANSAALKAAASMKARRPARRHDPPRETASSTACCRKGDVLMLAKSAATRSRNRRARAAQNAYFAEGYTLRRCATLPPDIAFLTSAAGASASGSTSRSPFSTGLDALLANPTEIRVFRTRQIAGNQIRPRRIGSGPHRLFTRDYKRGSPEGQHPWHGEPILSEDEFIAQGEKGHDRGGSCSSTPTAMPRSTWPPRASTRLYQGRRQSPPIVIHRSQRRDQLATMSARVGPAISEPAWYGAMSTAQLSAEASISSAPSARAAGVSPRRTQRLQLRRSTLASCCGRRGARLADRHSRAPTNA